MPPPTAAPPRPAAGRQVPAGPPPDRGRVNPAGPQAPTLRSLAERALDLVLDPRLPHAAPYHAYRRRRYPDLAAPPQLAGPLRVCLSFDVEHDFGGPGQHGSAARFLPRYLEHAAEHAWRGTLYVQGALLPDLSGALLLAQAGHELGLHGLHHEVWGRSRWWQYRQGKAGLGAGQKRERLRASLALFAQAGLTAPRSFRAPYLNADRATLRLLAGHGFSSDSSPASYLGALPLARRRQGLWSVPVTAAPTAVRAGRLYRFPELAMGALADMSETEFAALVAAALRVQVQAGGPVAPHLVVLAHPWEFEPTPGVAHGSAENWGRLERLLGWLRARYDVRLCSVSELLPGAPAGVGG